MTPALGRAAGPLLVTVLSVALSACSGGGFGSEQPPPTPDVIRNYVALGDGFTAAPYAGRTVDEDCLRSDNNYPALLAAALDLDVTDVSCTGVGTRALTHRTRPPEGGAKVKAQVDAVGADTDLVTIGIGIEDQDLLTRMFEICATFPCRDPETRGQTFVRDVARMGVSLSDAVQDVLDRAPDARIVLVGYPQITPTDGDCRQLPDLTQEQLDAINTLLTQLNGQIRAIARRTASTYVDVADLSAGHELCSDDPWITGKKSVDGTSVAFHPRAELQDAIADRMKTQLADQ